ncbi:MAG: rhodanese-like domain-containing protein [Nitriliruptoraceae bacterium]
MPRITIAAVLAAARGRLVRLSPIAARDAHRAGAILLDVRTDEQRRIGGDIPGAIQVSLNVLEWRLDPDAPLCFPQAGEFDRQVIVLCQDGYCSSLAADRLRQLGYAFATDVDGGFVAWLDDGCPVADASV